MAAVIPGRTTHDHSGDLVVFAIGMRINHWWRPDLWVPALLAMPRMLAELSRDPQSGMRGYRLLLGADGPVVLQYWDSPERLYAYALDPAALHRPAWTAFNRRARRGAGAVGVWHETFHVAAAESIYVAMPPTGLARATRVIPVATRSDRAAQRLAAARTPTLSTP